MAFLLKQPGFFFTAQDLNSFVSCAFETEWFAGLKALLTSPSAQFLFTASQTFEEQKAFVERIVRTVAVIPEVKLRKQCWAGVVEEVLTRRPFTKHMALYLMEVGSAG